MRKVVPLALLLLAALAFGGAFAAASAIPAARARFGQEREDLFLLIALLILLAWLAAFWAMCGFRMLRVPDSPIGGILRAEAWGVFLVGILVAIAGLVAPDDLVISGVLALTCVFSAVFVLTRGKGAAGA